MGQTVAHWRGPGIKIDTPDVNGDYEFPFVGGIDFLDFTDKFIHDARNVATYATATITSKVYVSVHNRGVVPADNVQVMLLLANAFCRSVALPPNFAADVQAGTTYTTGNWRTVGVKTIHDVRPDAPKIVELPPGCPTCFRRRRASLGSSTIGRRRASRKRCVHVDGDQHDNISRGERKAAHKNLAVVQFTGTLPTPPPVAVPIRLHNAGAEGPWPFDMQVDLQRIRPCPPVRAADQARRRPRADWSRVSQRGDDFLPFREMGTGLSGACRQGTRCRTCGTKPGPTRRSRRSTTFSVTV